MGKKYVESLKAIDPKRVYEVKDALDVVLAGPFANFDETVELHLRLGVDSRHADQQVRGCVVLPNGTGKNVKVLVFAEEEKQDEAKKAGADVVGGEELVDDVQNGKFLDVDVVVASPKMMRVVGRLGKVLGPKGLMPSIKSGTVNPDVAVAVNMVKSGQIEYKLDKNNIIHCVIGKVSFGNEKLFENFESLVSAVVSSRPASFKGQFIKSCFAARTMGPGVKVNVSKYGD